MRPMWKTSSLYVVLKSSSDGANASCRNTNFDDVITLCAVHVYWSVSCTCNQSLTKKSSPMVSILYPVGSAVICGVHSHLIFNTIDCASALEFRQVTPLDSGHAAAVMVSDDNHNMSTHIIQMNKLQRLECSARQL